MTIGLLNHLAFILLAEIGLIGLIVTLAIVGLIVYGITLIPMPGWLRTTIMIVAAISVLFYLLNVFGITGQFRDIPVPRLR